MYPYIDKGEQKVILSKEVLCHTRYIPSLAIERGRNVFGGFKAGAVSGIPKMSNDVGVSRLKLLAATMFHENN